MLCYMKEDDLQIELILKDNQNREKIHFQQKGMLGQDFRYSTIYKRRSI